MKRPVAAWHLPPEPTDTISRAQRDQIGHAARLHVPLCDADDLHAIATILIELGTSLQGVARNGDLTGFQALSTAKSEIGAASQRLARYSLREVEKRRRSTAYRDPGGSRF